MPRLTDTQLVLLSNAAKRDDGALLPLPKRIAIEPRALTRVLKGLHKKGLVRELPVTPEATPWRADPKTGRHMLVITPAGLDAIGVVDERQRKNRNSGKRRDAVKRSDRQDGTVQQPSVRPGTKLATMITLLQRNEGATIAEIVEVTGWEQHSVRGTISGSLKKKMGLSVSSEAIEGRGRVYQIGKQP